jgi:hypothetical protein
MIIKKIALSPGQAGAAAGAAKRIELFPTSFLAYHHDVAPRLMLPERART